MRKVLRLFFTLLVGACFCQWHLAFAAEKGQATFLELLPGRAYAVVDGVGQISIPEPYVTADGAQEAVWMLPLRTIAESLGYQVTWDADRRAVVISWADHWADIQLGSNTCQLYHQGSFETIFLSQPSSVTDGNTFVPLDFMENCLKIDCYEDSSYGSILLSAPSPGARMIGADRMRLYLSECGKSTSATIVAVIDSGVDLSHAYLAERIVYPHNMVNGTQDVSDPSGHGTHVAGIIANCTPKSVKLMPVKVSDSSDQHTIAQGVRYAVAHNAKVINISLSATALHEENELLDAISQANQVGCTVVVAAGNDGVAVENVVPASSEDAIVVAAVNLSGELWAQSNQGSTVGVSAPGIGIVSTIPGNGCDVKSGTSMAAPFVSASAAMLYMDVPGIKPVEIKNLLTRYTRDCGVEGWDEQYGYGILDLARYVANRRAGIEPEYTDSALQRTKELDAEIDVISDETKATSTALIGFFHPQLLSARLQDTSTAKYQAGDYFAAGYLLERSLSYSTAIPAVKNNLAYMLRRGEYTSNRYTTTELLDDAMSYNEPFSYVNRLLLDVSQGDWEAADRRMEKLCREFAGSAHLSEIERFWQSLANRGDPEGQLILGWLMRYGVYDSPDASQSQFLDEAKIWYRVPAWLYEKKI